jgi:hypothetical protein
MSEARAVPVVDNPPRSHVHSPGIDLAWCMLAAVSIGARTPQHNDNDAALAARSPRLLSANRHAHVLAGAR